MSDPFVGREDEIAIAQGAWERASAGERQTLLLLGEPGIGKTRLASEVAASSARAGSTTIWGRAWEGGGAPALWPWIQILREAIEGPRAAEVLAGLGNRAAVLQQVLDPIPSPEVTALDPGSRFLLFDSVGALLSELSMNHPMTLIIDDLHAVDQTSLHLMHFLTRGKDPARILFIGTSRTAELRESPEASTVVSEIARESRALHLAGLQAREAGELIRAIAPRLSDEVISEVESATGGNPLFIREVAQLRSQHGEVSGSVPPPLGAIEAAIRGRIKSLVGEWGEVLLVAAVIGRTVSVPLLSNVVETPESVDAALSAAAAMQVIEVAAGGQRFEFKHDLVRQAFYEELGTERRRETHLAIAELLEGDRLLDSVIDADLLAHHFVHAGPDWHEKAAEYLKSSGDLSVQRFAFEAAQQRYERALDLYTGRDSTRCDLLISLGSVRQRLGDPAGKEDLLQAGSLARDLRDGDRLATALIELVGTTGGNPYLRADEWIDRIEDALENLPSTDSALRARMLAALTVLLSEPSDSERRQSALSEALELSHHARDPLARAEVLLAGAATIYFEKRDEQRAFVEELLEVSETLERSRSVHVRVRSKELSVHAHRYRTIFSLEEGDLGGFDRASAAVTRAAKESKQPSHVLAADCLRCARDQMTGRMAEIEARAARFPDLLPGDMLSTVAHFVETGWALFEQARLHEVRGLYQDLLDGMPRLVGLRIFLALEAIQGSRPTDARAQVEPVFADLAALPYDAQWHSFVTGLIWIARELEDSKASAELYGMLLPHQGGHIVISFGQASCYLGCADLALGIAAAGSGLRAKAIDHFERSIHQHSRIGATAWIARSQFELARVLVEEPTDSERLEDLLVEASENLRGTTMTYLAERVAQLQGRLEASSADQGLVLTREADIWRVGRHGHEVRIRSMRGLEYLARLVAAPGQEIHAADLLSGGTSAPDDTREVPGTSRRVKDPILDDRAAADYRRRISDLQDELADAADNNDLERTARLKAELDLLVDELERASGWGGRRQAFADADERARVSVTKAIKRAVATIGSHDRDLERHLEETVVTGTFCAYRP